MTHVELEDIRAQSDAPTLLITFLLFFILYLLTLLDRM